METLIKIYTTLKKNIPAIIFALIALLYFLSFYLKAAKTAELNIERQECKQECIPVASQIVENQNKGFDCWCYIDNETLKKQ